MDSPTMQSVSYTRKVSSKPAHRAEETSEIRARARLDAQQVLESSWDSAVVPVDPVRIARAFGVEVFHADLREDLSGLFSPAREEHGPEIYVDTDESPIRQRFTTAHELGHFIEDGNGLQVDRRRDDLARTGRDPNEIYANEFAAALLMPEYAVKRLLAGGMPAERMHEVFKVSRESMGYRLQNLGLS